MVLPEHEGRGFMMVKPHHRPTEGVEGTDPWTVSLRYLQVEDFF